MKKIIIALGVFLLMITGCGSKELVCTSTETFAGETYTERLTFVFNRRGQNMVSYTIFEEQTYNDVTEMDEDYANLIALCERYKFTNGVTCSISRSGNRLALTWRVVIAELDRGLDEAATRISQKSIEELRELMESDNYICN